MKICVPKLNKEGFGGGWTFMANLKKGMEQNHQFVDESGMSDSDVVFIPNPMWAERIDFENAKALGKRVALRLDNIPEDWNNRGTAISKLKDFIQMSDFLIFQSDWARGKYLEFIKLNNLIAAQQVATIQNSVDTDLFNPNGAKVKFSEGPVLLFVKSSRNENKRYPEVLELYRRYWAYCKERSKPEPLLILVGQFSRETIEYNFGFYNGENFRYLGVMELDQLAPIYRSSDVLLFPCFADAAPNTVLEAMASGCVPIIHPYGGGAEFFGPGENERGVIMHGPGYHGGFIELALKKDKDAMVKYTQKNLNLKVMCDQYEKVMEGLIDG